MAKIPLPERGQPIDLSYIYDVAKAVNNLSEQISPATYKYVTVDTPAAGTQNARASEAKFIGGYYQVTNNATVSSGFEKDFMYTFSADFKYPPIVTATPINSGDSSVGNNVSVTLTKVTTSSVSGVVRFNSGGNVSVGINLLMIGIPN